MLLLDALVRISAITMLLLLFVVAVRDLRWSRSWFYLAAASTSTAALMLCLSAEALAAPFWVQVVAGFLNVPHLIFVWLFALSVFQTSFSLRWWHIAVGLAYSAPIAWFRAFELQLVNQPPFWVNVCVSAGSIAFIAHLIWQVLREQSGDLIEPRRRSRSIFVGTLACVTISTGVADLYLIAEQTEWARLIKATCIWPAVFVAFIWLLRADDKSLIPPNSSPFVSLISSDVDGRDSALLKALTGLVEDDQVYLDPDLRISSLADKLGVTSHRLRSLINSGLGYENFSQFLNSRRIEAIKLRIDDPANDHVPLLTLALEGGFNSSSPFNRAFKQVLGTTPSNYRKMRTSGNRLPVKATFQKEQVLKP